MCPATPKFSLTLATTGLCYRSALSSVLLIDVEPGKVHCLGDLQTTASTQQVCYNHDGSDHFHIEMELSLTESPPDAKPIKLDKSR